MNIISRVCILDCWDVSGMDETFESRLRLYEMMVFVFCLYGGMGETK